MAKNFKKLQNKIAYQFDLMMAKGTVAMIGLLGLLTFVIALIVALISSAFTGGGIGVHMWSGLMHMLAVGKLATDSVDNVTYLAIMSLATLCGIFITSTLIGILTTGLQTRLEFLRQGRSTVIDEEHTVIFGFNDRVFVLLESLIAANANHKHQCVVIVDNLPTTEMDAAVRANIEDFRTTRILTRCGDIADEATLKRAGLENARSIIVNNENGSETLKTILTVSNYMNKHEFLCPNCFMTVILTEAKYIEPARLAGKERVEIIYTEDIIARIIAHTCGQNGLSKLLAELLSYAGDEIYFEHIPEMTGKKFQDVLEHFEHQSVIGFADANGKSHINPPMDTVIGEQDKIILIEEDDGAYTVSPPFIPQEELIVKNERSLFRVDGNLLVIGENEKLKGVLAEYDCYVKDDTFVRVLLTHEPCNNYNELKLKRIKIEFCNVETIDKATVEKALSNSIQNVLVLSDDKFSGQEEADADTLMRLIEINAVKCEKGINLAVTGEMNSRRNQKLVTMMGLGDFVVGSNITSLLAVQEAENRGIGGVFEELLGKEGSEAYLKPIGQYVLLDTPVRFGTAVISAARCGEVAIGFKSVDSSTGNYTMRLNPGKNEEIKFSESDYLVVIAKD